jgi:hypothetical protein
MCPTELVSYNYACSAELAGRRTELKSPDILNKNHHGCMEICVFKNISSDSGMTG